MSLFIVQYDRNARRLIDCEEFPGSTASEVQAQILTLEVQKPDHVEVVMLSAASADDLRATHGRYFRNTEQLAAAAHVTVVGFPPTVRANNSEDD